jgi:hypothetical protein
MRFHRQLGKSQAQAGSAPAAGDPRDLHKWLEDLLSKVFRNAWPGI